MKEQVTKPISPEIKQPKAENQASVSTILAGYSNPLQRKATEEEEIPVQKKVNNTGLPDNLKSGVENLSGIAMDDVKVHYNSSEPAQMQAHAYAQGTDIHIGPGQEQHLPHETWHVVQQKQGRVKPTMQMKGKINVNDDAGLENEADVMGAKALQMKQDTTGSNALQTKTNNISNETVQRRINWVSGNVLYDNDLALVMTGQGNPYIGFTDPLINGASMTTYDNFRDIYAVPKVKRIDKPENKEGKEKEKESSDDESWGGSEDVTATMIIENAPVANFGYKMHLPTKGEWTIRVSNEIAVSAIAKINRSIDTSTLGADVNITVVGLPSNSAFIMHTLDHEFEHVFIMINKLYNSLWDIDSKIENAVGKPTQITAQEYDLEYEYWEKILGKPIYSSIESFHKELTKAQDDFHGTPEGSYPKPTITIVNANKIIIELPSH